MINLEKHSGLPLELDEKTFELKFGEGIKKVEPVIRKFSEEAEVLMDPDSKPNPATENMYYMYRDVHYTGDESEIAKSNLRYDITIIPSIMLGQEYNKTVGHYHPAVPGHDVGYPELYEVIEGEALFLIQKMDPKLEKLITVIAIPAKAGDKVIYPPNYGHIIVNTGKSVLVTSNWVAGHFNSLYEPIKQKKGMAYYVIAGKDGKPDFIKNEKYTDQQPVRVLDIKDPVASGFGFNNSTPLYTSALKNLEILDFLNNPTKYAVELSTISS